jgi:AcrR family transcriptional regulator
MSTSPPESPKKYHHGNLRDTLTTAALPILESQGPDKISLREVARTVNVSPNAPYKHFPTKEEFLAALATKGFQQLEHLLAPAKDLTTGCETYISFALNNPNLYQLMFSPILAANCHGSELEQASISAYKTLLKHFNTENPNDPRALHAWALVHGIATLRINGLLSHPVPFAEIAKTQLFHSDQLK